MTSLFPSAICVVAGLASSSVFGANIIANGDWSSAGTWDAAVPNAAGAVAANSTGDSTRTATLDIDATVGVIRSTIRRSFTVETNGVNFLTLDNGAGAAAITGSTNGSFNVTVAVNPNLVLSGDLLVTQNSGSGDKRVDINGGITGTGNIAVSNNEGAGGGVRLDGGVNHVGSLTWDGTNTDTSWSNISGTIGSNVTLLTKDGTGFVTLSGASNAWSVGTVINAGTVRVTAVSNLGGASLSIASGAVLDLLANQLSQATLTSLTLGGTPFTTPGTYGATGSGATFINDTFFDGTGFVTLVPEPASLAMVGLGAMLMLPRRKRVD